MRALAGMAGAVALLSLAGPGRSRRAAAGFVPSSTGAPTPGAWYQSRRSDLLMGRGHRSISWRVLRALAPELGEVFADDTTRRAVVARSIVTAPQNAGLLCPARGRQLCDGDGRTLDTRREPLVWIPRFELAGEVVRRA